MKIFCNCQKDILLKTFEDTILQVVQSLEKTQNKFVEMVAKIEIEHFKQLEKQMSVQRELFEKTTDKFLKLMEEKPKIEKDILQEFEEKISRLQPEEKNTIEEDQPAPLSDFPDIPPGGMKNIQFEGEEEIFPTGL